MNIKYATFRNDVFSSMPTRLSGLSSFSDTTMLALLAEAQTALVLARITAAHSFCSSAATVASPPIIEYTGREGKVARGRHNLSKGDQLTIAPNGASKLLLPILVDVCLGPKNIRPKYASLLNLLC